MTVALPDVLDREGCAAMDAADPLASFRERFAVDDRVVYLDGNSLGRLPRDTPRRIASLVQSEWGEGLVRSWSSAGWMTSPQRVGDKVARLIGAREDEVLITDTTSVDLFKVIAAVLRARPGRSGILTEEANFPTDLYVADGAVSLLGDVHHVRRVPRADLAGALDDDTALLLLTHVDFRTGEMHDMHALQRAAAEAGALALWDLSHSTGAVLLDVRSAGVQLAVGCGYKYLNGGPGAPAFLYVARELQEELRNPIQGWLGHESPFTFEGRYRRAPGIRSWMSGSPPVMAIAALEVALDLFLEADMRRVAEKGSALTELFIRLADARLARSGFEVVTPRDASRRGAQVSLRHSDGFAIVRALIEHGVIGDFRDPDLCRFGLAPLYTRFVDVWDAVEHIAALMDSGEWRRPEYAERGYIT